MKVTCRVVREGVFLNVYSLALVSSLFFLILCAMLSYTSSSIAHTFVFCLKCLHPVAKIITVISHCGG